MEEPSVPRVRVVYADGDARYRTQLVRALLAHHEIELVSVTVDSPSALDAVARAEPEIALIAADLEPSSGIELADTINALDAATRVVLLADPRRVALSSAMRTAGLRGTLDRSLAHDRVADIVAGLGAPAVIATHTA